MSSAGQNTNPRCIVGELTVDQRISIIGSNEIFSVGSGQLGLGTTEDVDTPQVNAPLSGSFSILSASCGGAHSLGIEIVLETEKVSSIRVR